MKHFLNSRNSRRRVCITEKHLENFKPIAVPGDSSNEGTAKQEKKIS